MMDSVDSSTSDTRPDSTGVVTHLPNVCVSYVYRDAGNNKNFGELIFSNPRHLAVDQIWIEIRRALMAVINFFGEPMFRPERMSLPTAFLYALPCYSRNDDDHDWHELCSIEETSNPVTQGGLHAIDDFLGALLKTHSQLCASRN